MPRTARMVAPNMVYHVISRGNDRQWVFHDSEDFERYIETCKRYKKRYGFKLYHWVLMNIRINNSMNSDSKKRRSSFLVALLFAAGDAER